MKEARTLYAFLVILQLSLVQSFSLASLVAICFLDTVPVCLSQGVHGHQRSAAIAQN